MFHIIDDEESILEFLSELIKEMGFEAMTFPCPMGYLSYVDSPEYTVPFAVISDVNMPEMNGFQMLERLRSKHHTIRVAIMSGYYENREKTKRRACTFLQKPFDIDSVVQMIESFASCHEQGPDPKEYKCNAEAEKYNCPHASHCKNY
ncbi:MAG: response regulator [Mariprofundaceae bacterium]